MKTFEKDPDAVLDYYWHWVAWLGNDTINTHTFIVPDSLTLESSSEEDGVVTLWLSGGIRKASHIVTCEIITLGGRTEHRSAIFEMADR